MDNNEQIVRIWLETQGFLVQNRLKYKVSRGKSAGYCDIDLLAFRPSDGKKIVVDVTAWMTSHIHLSDVINSGRGTYYRIHNISSKESREKIREALNAKSNKEYEIWHVLSFISENQREQVTKELLKLVDRVVDFPEMMKDLVKTVRENLNVTQETETLHTIRALLWCNLIK